MGYKIEVFDQMEQPVLSVRTRTAVDKLPEVLGNVYTQVMQYMDSIGEMASDSPFVAYYNMDMQDMDIEVGFPVSRTLPEQGNIQSNVIPAGKHAVLLYKGPYKDIETAYTAIMAWFPANGHEALGPAYEFYLNDPCDTDEADLLTRIAMPLKD